MKFFLRLCACQAVNHITSNQFMPQTLSYQITMFMPTKIVTLLQAFAIEKNDRKTRNTSVRQDTLVK